MLPDKKRYYSIKPSLWRRRRSHLDISSLKSCKAAALQPPGNSGRWRSGREDPPDEERRGESHWVVVSSGKCAGAGAGAGALADSPPHSSSCSLHSLAGRRVICC